MKLLLDSANYDEITRLTDTSAISGVTTNPSLMAKESKGDYLKKIVNIAQLLQSSGLKKHLSVEVITLDPEKMFVQAIEIRAKLKFSDNLVDLHIKIPVTLDNLSVITSIEAEGIKVNATACMMHSQAKMALDAGASIISYFYNRILDEGGIDPNAEIHKTAAYSKPSETMWPNQSEQLLIGATDCYARNNISGVPWLKCYGPPQIICGSIRKPEDVTACWEAGATHVTASMKIIELLLSHPQTDIAIAGFQKDIEEWLK